MVNDSRMPGQMTGLHEGHVTHLTLEWSFARVSAVVSHKVDGQFEPFAARRTQERSFSRVTSHVLHQLRSRLRTFSTFRALVFLPMNIHMTVQVGPTWISFLTQHTLVIVLSGVHVGVL